MTWKNGRGAEFMLSRSKASRSFLAVGVSSTIFRRFRKVQRRQAGSGRASVEAEHDTAVEKLKGKGYKMV
jgi:hypothetical protein